MSPIYFLSKGSCQVAIRSLDDDYPLSDDDLIDIVVFNINITPSNEWVSMENRHGFYNRATVSAEFRVDCSVNYYGTDCSTYCVPTDNSQGHYICNSNGGKVCLSGWTNISGGQNCLTRMLTIPHDAKLII